MELFRDRVALPERIIEADNESVINNLVESGVGVSLIRDEIAAQSRDAGRSVIWPGLRVTTQLWFVYPAARAADPLLVAIRDVLGDDLGGCRRCRNTACDRAAGGCGESARRPMRPAQRETADPRP